MRVIRGTMLVSMLYYSLKRRTKFTIRRSSLNWIIILMKRIWMLVVPDPIIYEIANTGLTPGK